MVKVNWVLLALVLTVTISVPAQSFADGAKAPKNSGTASKVPGGRRSRFAARQGTGVREQFQL